MQTSTVRIDQESNEILHEISELENLSRRKIIHTALVDYKRKYFLNKCAEAYANLKSDKKSWKEEMKEREIWDSAISDGLEKDE